MFECSVLLPSDFSSVVSPSLSDGPTFLTSPPTLVRVGLFATSPLPSVVTVLPFVFGLPKSLSEMLL